jgi:hypothetical protein
LVHAVLLKNLPVTDPKTLVRLGYRGNRKAPASRSCRSE